MNIENKDGIEFLKSLDDNSIDLIITDPPYLISKETGMNKFEKEVQKIDQSGKNKKTLEEWELFKVKKGYTDDKYRNNYIKYGNTSGNKFAFKTDFEQPYYKPSICMRARLLVIAQSASLHYVLYLPFTSALA